MIWRQHIHKVVPGPGWFRIWKCWSLRRGENRRTRSTRFSLKFGYLYKWGWTIFCVFYPFFFSFYQAHCAFIELGIYCFLRVVEDFELFLKSFIEKMIIRIPRCLCVLYLAQSSHQSLGTSTICITAPSKEKARTFYMFPFHWCNFF